MLVLVWRWDLVFSLARSIRTGQGAFLDYDSQLICEIIRAWRFNINLSGIRLRRVRMQNDITLGSNMQRRCSWMQTPCRCLMSNTAKMKTGGLPSVWIARAGCWSLATLFVTKRRQVREYV